MLLLAVSFSPALSAPRVHIIRDDPGGYVMQYIAKYARWFSHGDSVKVDGECASACTMVVVATAHVCATKRARFLFHSASLDGLYHEGATNLMWGFFPQRVRAALAARGWPAPSPHPDLIEVPAHEIMPRCPD